MVPTDPRRSARRGESPPHGDTSIASPPPVQPACSVDPELFFDGRYTAFARALCARCPLGEPCLAYALAVTVDGVWAGTTRAERVRLRRERGITAVPQRWDDPMPAFAA